jgi:putative membrane protein
MEILISVLIAVVALMHFYFLWLEMFAWTTRGPKVFRNFPKDLFAPTKKMAANQGLYNGFLAAGLVWTFFISDAHWKAWIALFFLSCIAVAGLYGAWTVSRRIFFVQAAPALITILLIVSRRP